MDRYIISLGSKFDGYGFALLFFIILVLSIVLSSIIGVERELRGHSAGLRTHVLICAGSAILMFISIYAVPVIIKSFNGESYENMFEDTIGFYDASRIAAGIIAGLGFICAGTIIKTGFSIRGLTTSTTLWVVGAIGMLAGAGLILEAIIATVITIIILMLFIYFEKFIDKISSSVVLTSPISYNLIDCVQKVAATNDIIIKKIVTEISTEDKNYQMVTFTFAYSTKASTIENMMKLLENNENIKVEQFNIKQKKNKR